MGLKATIQAATVSAIAAIGDLANVAGITYKQLTESEYNPTTGTTDKKILLYKNVTVTFVDFDRRLIDGVNIRPNDQRALIAGSTISFVPEAGGDELEFTNSRNRVEVWEVINVEIDPAGALYDLQIRKKE